MSVHIPLSQILSWPKPNLVDPQMRGNDYLVSSVIFFSISLFAVSGRLWYKATKGRLWWDDVACVLALCFTVALTVIISIAAYHGGWRNHLYDVLYNVPLLTKSLKLVYAAYILYAIAATVSRLACLLLYYRLFASRAGHRYWTYLLHGVIISIVACNIIFACLTAFGCRPITLFWTVPGPPDISEHCVSIDKVVLTFAVINVAQDILTAILPIPVVFKLQMPLRERVGVIVVLTLGAFAMISSAVKCYFIWYTLLGTWDRTWHILDAWTAGLVELNVIITCSCAPALKPLLTPFATKALTKLGVTTKGASRLTSTGGRDTPLDALRSKQSGIMHSSKHSKKLSQEQVLIEEVEAKSDGVVMTRSFYIDHDDA